MKIKNPSPAHVPVTRRTFLAASGATLLASCGGGGSSGSASVPPSPTPTPTPAPPFPTSRETLDSYLARSIDMHGWTLLEPFTDDVVTQHHDNLRMIANIGAKHVAFVTYFWWNMTVTADSVEPIMTTSQQVVSDIHAQDASIIVGAACFETIGPGANSIAVPDWVLTEFNQPVVTRNFDWTKMVYSDQRPSDGNPATPAIDITQLESRMWYYYWSRRYIDLGFEDIHFGEIFTVTQNDIPTYSNYWDLVGRVRKYAATKARRGLVLINANSYPADSSGKWNDATGLHGIVNSAGYLALDYCYAPLRPEENPSSPQDAVLDEYQDTIFGKSAGGISPNGWSCTSCPYVVQLDPGGSPKPGVPIGYPWVWGWSEWDWYVNQPASYRASWLWYAQAWLAKTDATGHLRMPGMSGGGGLPGIGWYHANIPWYSQSDPNATTRNQWFLGFNDEPTIKAIWSHSADPNILNGNFARPVLGSGQTDVTAPAVPSWSFTGTAGVAGAGSSYVGSQTLAGGQQVAFVAGRGALSQALLFPGGKAYQLQVSAAERVANGATDSEVLTCRSTAHPSGS